MNCLVSDGEKYCGKPATQIYRRLPICDWCLIELKVAVEEHLESKIPDPPASQSGTYT